MRVRNESFRRLFCEKLLKLIPLSFRGKVAINLLFILNPFENFLNENIFVKEKIAAEHEVRWLQRVLLKFLS